MTVEPPSVLPASEFLDERTRVLKHGDTFAVFNRLGDAQPLEGGGHGLYHGGTRFLTQYEMLFSGEHPLLLGSTVTQDNALLTVDLTNPALRDGERVLLAADTVHLFRTKFLWNASCYERVRISNHGTELVRLTLTFEASADFADIFEVRGQVRARRGALKRPEVPDEAGSSLVLSYAGLDGLTRRTRIECSPTPASVDASTIRYELTLGPKAETEIHIAVHCETEEAPARSGLVARYDDAYQEAWRCLRGLRGGGCEITTSNELFNSWIRRSFADLYMMLTALDDGPYPYAGVPWYNTVFGRDGLITALETLWVDPSVARGVLLHLARTQATGDNAAEDASFGKILHESRLGEMAALGEVPFGRYYGTIDATPLFVILADAYYDRTGDLETIRQIWSNIDNAISWMDNSGDMDGDGFLEYARRSPSGLVQQGWKDSNDSVFHADGTLVEGPVALCEVQGYSYAARRAAAHLAKHVGAHERGRHFEAQALEVQRRFEEAFWSDEIACYALALDGKKRPCHVRTSNAGHCLWTGIASMDRARRTARTLMGQSMFSGWGVRTVAEGEVRYNPMSYHNGSVWPHDNAIIAAGMARYGFKSAAAQILSALFDVSLFVDLHRMPELFCGFARRPGQGPTMYPTACAPQAWAAAAVFLLLQSVLGLSLDATSNQIRFSQPVLPSWVDWIEIRNLVIDSASVDLLLRRARHDVSIEVLRKAGDAEVAVTKAV